MECRFRSSRVCRYRCDVGDWPAMYRLTVSGSRRRTHTHTHAQQVAAVFAPNISWPTCSWAFTHRGFFSLHFLGAGNVRKQRSRIGSPGGSGIQWRKQVACVCLFRCWILGGGVRVNNRCAMMWVRCEWFSRGEMAWAWCVEFSLVTYCIFVFWTGMKLNEILFIFFWFCISVCLAMQLRNLITC